MLPEATYQRLRTQLDCLPVLLAGADENLIDRRPASGKWSARENLAHLARYQGVFIDRVSQILIDDKPSFRSYKAETDPEWPEWASLPAGDVFLRLQAGRAQIMARFEGLTDAQLARVGRHSRFGELTLLQWVEFFLLHEAHHLLAVLQRLRSAE
jgi:hypothetical protein